MINNKSVLAIIPARGGSKGIARKNIKPLGGRPLIAWTIEAAGQSKYIDRLILSSEDREIIRIAESCGCEAPFARPAELATDEASVLDSVFHAVRALPERYDYLILLQPTSPLRSPEDIDSCLELCLSQNAPACVSVTECAKHPYWMYSTTETGQLRPAIPLENRPERRQDLPTVFELNGAVYVARTDWILSRKSFVEEETVAYHMPRERSLDIDTERDLIIANLLIQEKESNHESPTGKICRIQNRRNQQTEPESCRDKKLFKEMVLQS